MLRLFNSLTHQLEDFVPLNPPKVGIYTCGPTVYNFPHIGNYRAYTFADLLKRYLKYAGFKVKHVMNLTDVDDKTIKGSQKAGKSLQAFTDFYAEDFIKGLKLLNIEIPDVLPRATAHIPEMLALVKKLTDKGLTYKAPDGSIYFDISKFQGYGRIANLEAQDLKTNAAGRLNSADEYQKEDAADFALWKAYAPSDGEVAWDSDFGRGRPGWHIECSAMSMKYLGESFDIHTGGVDLVFPHHTNEIAQSEGATGKPFVKYWLHNEFLNLNNAKISKSLGNTINLPDIIAAGYNPLLLRIALLKINYRTKFNFSFDNLEEARGIARRFIEFLSVGFSLIGERINTDFVGDGLAPKGTLVGLPSRNVDTAAMSILIEKTRVAFKEALDDDLNISAALAVVFGFMDNINGVGTGRDLSATDLSAIRDFIYELDQVLGFIKPLYDEYQQRLTAVISDPAVNKLLEERLAARKNKDFAASDAIRDQLASRGLLLKDTKSGLSLSLSNFP